MAGIRSEGFSGRGDALLARRQPALEISERKREHVRPNLCPKGGLMARVINCDCGYVVRGETDEELLAGAHRHIEESHPDMIGKVSDSDLLARAEEA